MDGHECIKVCSISENMHHFYCRVVVSPSTGTSDSSENLQEEKFQRMFHCCNVKCCYRLTNTYRRFPQTFREQGAVVYGELVQNLFHPSFHSFIAYKFVPKEIGSG